MEDIVERLRDGQFCGQRECHYHDVMRRAADEIERLRAEIGRLEAVNRRQREALVEIKRGGNAYNGTRCKRVAAAALEVTDDPFSELAALYK